MDSAEDKLQKWRERSKRTSDLQDEALPIVRGLRDGDLTPLVDYLKSGGLKGSPEEVVSIPAWVAEEIVAMIEKQPWCWFRLELVGRSPNVQGWSRELELEKRDFTIGYFMVKQQRGRGRGSYEGVLQDAEAEFRVDRATVKRAHAFVKGWILGHKKAGIAGGETEAEVEARLTEILDQHHERDMREFRGKSRE